MFGIKNGLVLSRALWRSTKFGKGEKAPITASWLGGPTLLFRFGPLTILTDPVLGADADGSSMLDPNREAQADAQASRRPLSDVPVGTADLILISHDHADHLDEAALARLAGRSFVVPIAQAEKLKQRGVVEVLGLPWHAAHRLSRSNYSVRITAVPAQFSPRSEPEDLLGLVNGYWLEFRHREYRRTVYWTGDALPVAAELSPELRKPDLLVPHLCEFASSGSFEQMSMGPRQAISLARTIEPKRVLPIHDPTFARSRTPIDLFARAATREPWKLDVMREGGELVLH